MEDLTSQTLDKIYEKGAASRPPIETPDGGLLVMVPEGYTAHAVAPLERPLPRIRQAVTLKECDSFISYVNRYKSESTRIFALPGHQAPGAAACFHAVLDYHQKDAAAHGVHIARFAPPYSEQWKRWTGAKPMNQPQFAEFIEDNRKDIVVPEAAALMDVVSKFRAKKTQEYDAVVYQSNGDLTLSFSEKTEHAGGGKQIVVPQELKLGIPVYFKTDNYEIPVFLRYRLKEAALTFEVKVDRGDYVEQAAFDTIAAKIAKATGIEIYIGDLR